MTSRSGETSSELAAALGEERVESELDEID